MYAKKLSTVKVVSRANDNIASIFTIISKSSAVRSDNHFTCIHHFLTNLNKENLRQVKNELAYVIAILNGLFTRWSHMNTSKPGLPNIFTDGIIFLENLITSHVSDGRCL